MTISNLYGLPLLNRSNNPSTECQSQPVEMTLPGRGITIEEEIALCKAWVAKSEDSVQGNGKKAIGFEGSRLSASRINGRRTNKNDTIPLLSCKWEKYDSPREKAELALTWRCPLPSPLHSVCLQELDNYDNFYKEKVGQFDYSSIYVKRGGTKKDGCGIFYKHSKMELVIEEKIDYNDLAKLILDESTRAKPKEKALNDMNGQGTSSKDHGDPNDPYVRLKRDCVGIIGAFKFREPYEHYVIVANSHIYWDPEWADVKLAQAKYLLSRVAQFKKMVSGKFECTPSLLIVGDFNSVPEDKVYQYLVSGGSVA
ncbi:DNAse I-like superfamily protein [Tanacetum coccineum]